MKKSLLILLCGLVFVYTACDEYDDTYPAEYHKIMSLKQTGEVSTFTILVKMLLLILQS